MTHSMKVATRWAAVLFVVLSGNTVLAQENLRSPPVFFP